MRFRLGDLAIEAPERIRVSSPQKIQEIEIPFDDNLVSRPGPRLVDGLEALAKLLHPGVFK